jgi:Ca2+-transporting ATPase
MRWHSISAEQAIKETGGSMQGLTDDQVSGKLSKHGRNELKAKKKRSPILIFLSQFIDIMILVLVAAAIISAFIGELSDSVVIVVIIFLNAIVGFIQEYRAEKAMEALQKMAVPVAKVFRNGQRLEIPSPELVPGDIMLVEAGNLVAADSRLIEVHALKAEEASLTGESNAIDKTTDSLEDKDLSPGDRTNIIFKGTTITNGRGKSVVIATGMQTELGRIAGMLQEKESTTPLQKRMADFSKKLTVIILILCAIFFGIAYFRGEDVGQMLLTAISLAVAAIPEALPAVITISLALGAKKLIRQHVLIRKLHAVETLGSVTYICSDKTGTLTKNEMTVKEVWARNEDEILKLVKSMSLNHDVKQVNDTKKMIGDPTEIALASFASNHENFDKQWKKDYPRVDEVPFDSDRKAMTTIHDEDGKYSIVTKGALESLWKISRDQDEAWKKEEERMAKQGMRVIAFATKRIDKLPDQINPQTIESELELIGLAGLIDPPREEAKQAILECKTAGIKAVMITGDHPLTAAAIARELGILETKEDLLLTGTELAELSEEAFLERVEKVRVYARVSPEQKLNIIKALQSKDHFVAMTGDGVNDAPSLRKANIGIAMGITGTDVTKAAAHMILLDDNFATIIKAVRQGRRIYDNIRKFIKYIMTGNSAEIWTIFLAPFFGLPVPLLPVHILWINLVTDGLPALALAAEPAEKDIMKRKPRKTDESIFAGGVGWHILWVGILAGLVCIAMQWYEIKSESSNWQTIVFTTLCFAQLWHVMAVRSDTRSLFKQGFFSNKTLLGAVVATLLLQLAVIYIPSLNTFFHTSPLTWKELVSAVVVSSTIFWAVELEKFFKRRRPTRASQSIEKGSSIIDNPFI